MEEEVKLVSFGLNLDKYTPGDAWKNKVEEFRQTVEKNGVARATWTCFGRTRHHCNAIQLSEALPWFEWTIDYDTYMCQARKKKKDDLKKIEVGIKPEGDFFILTYYEDDVMQWREPFRTLDEAVSEMRRIVS